MQKHSSCLTIDPPKWFLDERNFCQMQTHYCMDEQMERWKRTDGKMETIQYVRHKWGEERRDEKWKEKAGGLKKVTKAGEEWGRRMAESGCRMHVE